MASSSSIFCCIKRPLKAPSFRRWEGDPSLSVLWLGRRVIGVRLLQPFRVDVHESLSHVQRSPAWGGGEFYFSHHGPVPKLDSWVLSSLSAGHSPQRWSDVSSASLQSLQVDGRDSLHLGRCPAKRPWPVAAWVRVVSSFVLIPLVNFLCCVVGTAKNVLAVQHCGIVCHHCCHLCSAFFPLFFLPVCARAGDKSWTVTVFSFAILSSTLLPVTPECPQTNVISIWHMSFADTDSSIVSSTSLLVGFREKMDCRADCKSVHSFTFIPFSLWGFCLLFELNINIFFDVCLYTHSVIQYQVGKVLDSSQGNERGIIMNWLLSSYSCHEKQINIIVVPLGFFRSIIAISVTRFLILAREKNLKVSFSREIATSGHSASIGLSFCSV